MYQIVILNCVAAVRQTPLMKMPGKTSEELIVFKNSLSQSLPLWHNQQKGLIAKHKIIQFYGDRYHPLKPNNLVISDPRCQHGLNNFADNLGKDSCFIIAMESLLILHGVLWVL